MQKERSLKSKVLQIVRKNQVIWIHDSEFGRSPLRPNYDVMNDYNKFREFKKSSFKLSQSKVGFIETMDRNGNTAYIKRSHVKLIYKDAREFVTSVKPFEQDTSDYRLEEPLPTDYPLTDSKKRRAFIYGIFGPSLRARYTYTDDIASTDRSPRRGFAFGYAKKANWDNTDRFYFGGYGHVLASKSTYTFSSGSLLTSSELLLQLSLGPFLSYDIYRHMKWKVSVGGGVNINWNRNFIKIGGEDENEERLFQGLAPSPRFFSNLHWKNFIVPKVDLVLGVDMQLNLAQSYTNNSDPSIPQLWTDSEGQLGRFESPTGGVLTVFLGIQSNY